MSHLQFPALDIHAQDLCGPQSFDQVSFAKLRKDVKALHILYLIIWYLCWHTMKLDPC